MGVRVISSVLLMLFLHVGWLVSYHTIIFCLLVILINLLIILYLSLSEHAIFKIISRRRCRGRENTLSHIIRST